MPLRIHAISLKLYYCDLAPLIDKCNLYILLVCLKLELYYLLQEGGDQIITSCWKEIGQQCEAYKPSTIKQGQQSSGWKVIRVFVSSTFTDFFNEREILVKKVPNMSINIKLCKFIQDFKNKYSMYFIIQIIFIFYFCTFQHSYNNNTQ